MSTQCNKPVSASRYFNKTGFNKLTRRNRNIINYFSYHIQDRNKEKTIEMAIGYLIMQARTAHDAVPLSGIQVRVLDDRGNPIYNLMTDESGETLKVPLETLDKSFSQNQYFSGLPYLSYNVLAQGAGFNTLYITHIPIYDGETATLPLELVLMQTMQRRPEERKIFIGKPAVADRKSVV